MYRIYSTHGLFSILYLCAHPAKPGRDKREKYILSIILVIAVIPAVSPQTLLAITIKIHTGVKQASPILKVHLRDALFLFLHPHYLSIFATTYNVVIF